MQHGWQVQTMAGSAIRGIRGIRGRAREEGREQRRLEKATTWNLASHWDQVDATASDIFAVFATSGLEGQELLGAHFSMVLWLRCKS